MRCSISRVTATFACVSIVAVLVPALAIAKSPPAKAVVPSARVAPEGVLTQEPSNAINDLPTEDPSTDITAKIPKYASGDLRWGTAAGVVTGAIFPVTTATADVDWYHFHLTEQQYSDSMCSLLVDVLHDDANPWADPVVEVYHKVPLWGYKSVPAWAGMDDLSETYWTFESSNHWDDDSYWMDNRSPQASFLPHVQPGGVDATGTYFIRVRPYSNGGSSGFTPYVFGYQLRIKPGQVSRMAGPDRYATANAVSEQGWHSTISANCTVTIVNGTKFPDALSAAGLAGAGMDGPVLLCPGTTISHSTIAEIQRMGTNKIYLVGGTASVSAAVRTHILAHIPAANIARIDGANRYAVAGNAAREIKKLGGAGAHMAFVATGLDWPDALLATTMAYSNRMPLLLTRPDLLPVETKNAITAAGITDVIIVGGTGSVSNAVQSALVTKLGGDPTRVTRISAANRYALAKKFAWWACDLATPGTVGGGSVGSDARPTALSKLDYRHIGVVSGTVFADSLSAGAWCGKSLAPLLYTPGTSLSPYIFAEDESAVPAGGMYFNGDSIRRSYVIGGAPTVSNTVLRDLDYNTGFAGPGHQ